MKWKDNLRKYLPVFGVLLIGAVAIGFVNKSVEEKVCKDVVINMQDEYDNFFVDHNQILSMMTNGNNQVLIGTPLAHIDLKELESRIKANPFINSVQVYRDMKGYIMVDVTLRKPVLRILNSKGPDAYVDANGTIFPTSDDFTSRVILLDGKGAEALLKTGFIGEEGDTLLELIEFISNDPTWSKQITQITIESDGDMIMWPQLTKQYIEFGTMDDYKTKFKKLDIFYKQILPRNGWNTYEKVNLKYKDQIIAD
jgi:cell division protein FtsQ